MRRVWVISCNWPLCREVFIAEGSKAVAARGEAREQGWRPDGAQWLCPAHRAEQDDGAHEPWCPAVTRRGQCRCQDGPAAPPRGGTDIWVAGSTVTVVNPPGDIL